MPPEIPQPWRGFLRDLDRTITAPAQLRCLGGFVVAMQYGLERPTADIDFSSLSSSLAASELIRLGGRGSKLHREHGIYLDLVILTVEPANYEQRVSEMFPGELKRLRLMALDPYDLALTRLDRNSPKDREDFRHLARFVPLDMDALRARYAEVMAPNVWPEPDRKLRLTLDFWIADVEEERTGPRP
jgi:uncharacterized nucleotidyltransferase DUF6036